MYDIIIRNGSIINGNNEESFIGNLYIKDGTIVKVDACKNPKNDSALEVIDATGLTVSPGFIDVHGHTDMFILVDPACSAKLKQGITTELGGQCGFSLAPVSEEHWLEFYNYYKRLGAPLNESFKNFTSFKSYIDTISAIPIGINLGMFVGHGTIRIAAMGLGNQEPSEQELSKMKNMLEEAISNGAFGLSSGLMYAPGSYAAENEITELCKVMHDSNGIYTSHIRNQGNKLLDSIDETINVGKNAGVKVNVSHHKAAGKDNWGKTTDSCKKIKEAKKQGVKVTHDVYPYTASSTTLSATLPPSSLKDGAEVLLNNLQSKDYCQSLREQIFNPTEEWDNDIKINGFESILIIRAPQTANAVGKTISEFAEEMGMDCFDAYIYLLLKNHLDVSDICFAMSEQDVIEVISEESCLIGTDSLYIPGMPMTHPRSIGSFPRVLAKYVREDNVLNLNHAIYKMTGLAAKTYGIKNKGFIKEGYDADIVIFDKEKIQDKSTYTNPIQENEGINFVIVNGQIAVKDNKLTTARAGKIILSNK